MRKILLFLLLVMSVTAQAAGEKKKLVILHTNDLHSRLAGFAPESEYTPMSVNDDATLGGFARIAAVIGEEKSNNEGNTLVLDAGDFLMGTLFQAIEPSDGFQLRLMHKMGYDAVAIGNHEFDLGPSQLAGIVNASVNRGSIPQLLLGNAVFDTGDDSDDSLEDLFSRGVIGRWMVITRADLRIGIFSLLGSVAAGNAAFAKPVSFSGQIATAAEMVSELRDEGCDIIICLSHSGVSRDKKGLWSGEDVKLAEKVKGIDVIISGHTHTQLSKPVMVNGVPVVQTGEYGRNIGKLTLGYSDGQVTVDGYELIPVDDSVMGDRETDLLVSEKKELVNTRILRPPGLDYDRPVAEAAFVLECNEAGDVEESNLGPLVADAIRIYVNRNDKTGTDIAMVAVGVIRDRIVPGYQTAPDIFRIMSMGSGNDAVPGYPLARIFLTGKELRNILGILLFSSGSTPANYCYYSGLKAEINPRKFLTGKVERIWLEDPGGSLREISLSGRDKTLYSVTANAYMLEYVGLIRKMSFGLLNIVPKDQAGNPITDMKKAIIDLDEESEGVQEGKEWMALMEYLSMMKDTDGNMIPEIDPGYARPRKALVTKSR